MDILSFSSTDDATRAEVVSLHLKLKTRKGTAQYSFIGSHFAKANLIQLNSLQLKKTYLDLLNTIFQFF